MATKVWTPDDDEAERQIDASLAFFGGHVEVFQVHNLVGWRTRLDQLERRRDRGELDIVAATHWQASAFDELEDGHAHRAHRGRSRCRTTRTSARSSGASSRSPRSSASA